MAIVKDIDITPEQRQLVCSIFATHLPDTEVWAYGSRVHWNATPSSDLDLVAFCSDKSGLANCRDAFAESSLPFRVDLFLWDEIPENFQDRIKQEYAVLISKKEVKWNKITFDDDTIEIIDGDRGTNYPRNTDFSSKGYCLFLNTGNVTKNGFNFSDCMFISEEKDNALRKGKLQRNDIVLTTRGTVGNVALYDEKVAYSDVRINSGMVIFRFNTSKILPQYAYYYLTSPFFRGAIEKACSGSAQPQLPIRDIKSLDFLYPSLSEQKRIAGILSTFDDKIELNRKMSKTLEAMVEALFKSWFVDFEPVRAKIAAIGNGKDPELAAMMSISGKTEVQLAEMKTFYPDAYSELAHTASLFPSTMVENEDFYEIPEDWDIYNFSDILQESKEKCGDLDVPEFSVTDNGIVPRNEKFKKNLSASKNKNKLLCKNQLVFGMSREILNWGIMADEVGGVSSVYNVFNVSSDIDPEYLRMFITNQLIYFKDLIKPAAREGQSIDRKVLMQKKIYIPSKKLLEYWLKLHSTMNNRMKRLMEQQQTHLKQQENILQNMFINQRGLE